MCQMLFRELVHNFHKNLFLGMFLYKTIEIGSKISTAGGQIRNRSKRVRSR